MKKLSLLVGGLILSTAVMAQKPSADVPMTLEGQLGYNAATLSFNAPAIRMRYFLTDNIAARVTFGINGNTQKATVYENPDFTGDQGDYKVTANGWNAAIGGEYHFAGTDRLSPFVALDIRFGGTSNTFEGENATATIDPATLTADITTAGYVADYSENGEVGTSNFGVALTGGVDYYFAENFYFGLELGFMWMTSKTKDATVEFTTGGTTTTTDIPSSTSNSNWMTATAVPAGNFRLGWRF